MKYGKNIRGYIMKRKTVISKEIILLVTFVLLTGCGKKPVDSVNVAEVSKEADVAVQQDTQADETREEITQKTDELTEETVSNTEDMSDTYKEQYKNIMAAIKGFIKYGAEETNPGFYGLEETVHYVGKDSIGYAFKDINGDNIPELFIGCFENEGNNRGTGKEINAVWAISEDGVVPILEGWSRSRVYLLDDNSLYNEGASSATQSCAGVMTYRPGDKEYTVEDFYFTDETYPGSGEIVCYHNTTGSWEAAESDEVTLTKEDFWRITDEFDARIVDIEFTQLIIDDVSVAFADDTVIEDTECKSYVVNDSDYSERIVLTTGNKVTDFRIVELKYDESNESGLGFIANNLYYCDSLEEGEQFVVQLSFPGDMPANGIVYVGQDGEEKSYGLSLSGYDGSVLLSEINVRY